MHVLLMYNPDPPSAAHVERLRGLAPDLNVTVVSSAEEARESAGSAEVILGQRYLRQALPHAPTSAGSSRHPRARIISRSALLPSAGLP